MKTPAAALRSEINVTPLVDVVLVLLILFMVATPLLRRGYDVATPGTRAGAAAPEGQIVVSLLRSGEVFLNRDRVAPAALAEALAGALKGRSAPTVFFAADNDVVYGDAMSVLDTVRAAGARIAVAPPPRELGIE